MRAVIHNASVETAQVHFPNLQISEVTISNDVVARLNLLIDPSKLRKALLYEDKDVGLHSEFIARSATQLGIANLMITLCMKDISKVENLFDELETSYGPNLAAKIQSERLGR